MAGFDYAEYQRRKAALAEQDAAVIKQVESVQVQNDLTSAAQFRQADRAESLPEITVPKYINPEATSSPSGKLTNNLLRGIGVTKQEATAPLPKSSITESIMGKPFNVEQKKALQASLPGTMSDTAAAWQLGKGQELITKGYQQKIESNDPTAGEDLIAQGQALVDQYSWVQNKGHKSGEGKGILGYTSETAKALSDPNFWKVNMVQQGPSNLKLMAEGMAGGLGANILRGIGAVGVASGIGAAPGAALIAGGNALQVATTYDTTVKESKMEAANTYEQKYKTLITGGVSKEAAHQQAMEAADKNYKANLLIIGGSNALEQLSVFGVPLGYAKDAMKVGGKATKAIGDTSKFARVAGTAAKETGRVTATGLTEGGQELAQYGSGEWAQGTNFGDIDWSSPEAMENFTAGFGMGAGMHTVGRTADVAINGKKAFESKGNNTTPPTIDDPTIINDLDITIKQRTIQELPDEMMPQVQQEVIKLVQQGVEPAEAIEQVLNEVAQLPEVAAQIDQITQEEAAKTVEVLSQQTKAEPTTNNEAAGETVNVVYTKSGKALEVVDQSSPEFYVVLNDKGERDLVAKDDVTEPVEVIKSVLNPTAKSEPAEAVKTTEPTQAQQGETGQPNIVAPELQANAVEGQIEGTEAKPEESPVNIAPNVINEAEIASNATSNVTDNIENNIEAEAQPEKEPWQMTKEEHRKKSISEVAKSIYDFITKSTGTDDLQAIADHYVKKYGLPRIRIILKDSANERDANASDVKEYGTKKTKYTNITLPKGLGIARLVEILRHEIEHSLDTNVRGYVDENGVGFQSGKTGLQGKSHFSEWEHEVFSNDYVHKRSVLQALSEGKEVPAEVLADYPDLITKPAPEAEVSNTLAEDLVEPEEAKPEAPAISREEEAEPLVEVEEEKPAQSNNSQIEQIPEPPKVEATPEPQEEQASQVKVGDTVYFKNTGKPLKVLNVGNDKTLRVENEKGNRMPVRYDEITTEKPGAVKTEKPAKVEPKFAPGDVVVAQDGVSKYLVTQYEVMDGKLTGMNPRGGTVNLAADHMTKVEGETYTQAEWVGIRTKELEQKIAHINEGDKVKWTDQRKGEELTGRVKHKTEQFGEPALAVNVEQVAFLNGRVPIGRIEYVPASEKTLQKIEETKPETNPQEPVKNKDRSREWLAKTKADAEARIKANKNRMLSGLPMDDMLDYSIIGMCKLAEKTLDLAAFSKEMIDEYGPALKNWMAGIFAQSQAMLDMTEEDLNQMIEDSHQGEKTDIQNTENEVKSGQEQETKEGGENGERSGDTGTGEADKPNSIRNGGTPERELSQDVPQDGTGGNAPAIPEREVGDVSGNVGTDNGPAKPIESDTGESEPAGSVSTRPTKQGDSGGTAAGDEVSDTAGPESIKRGNAALNNFQLTQEFIEDLLAGGEKTKAHNNIAAIKLVKQLEAEERLATPDEQRVLAKFVGWGGLSEAFGRDSRWDSELRQYTYTPKYPKWAKEYYELQEILTKEEYDMASRSVQYAHYTAPMVTQQMYKALNRMGFKRGTILEPSMGSGIFFGTIPENITATKLVGVEIDPITGLLAKHLYQKADVKIMGFQDTSLPDDYFDVAISNVPFGDIAVTDNTYKENFKTARIHNYFFVKALDKVRPGGLIAFITSTGTMNANDVTARQLRQYMDQNAEFVGAIRLPGNAFKRIANTEVTTDIIFMRKPFPFETIENKIGWQKIEDSGIKGLYDRQLNNNEYYVAHPDMMLGDLVEDKLHLGRIGLAARAGADLEAQLQEAISKLPADIFQASKSPIKEPAKRETLENTSQEKQGSFVVEKGKAYQVSGKELIPINGIKVDKIEAFIKLKNALYAVIDAQQNNETDKAIQGKQKTLGKIYDDFVKAHGYLSDKATKSKFMTDPAYNLLNTLEIKKADGTYAKADIFTKRTIENVKTIDKADNATDGLVISLNQIGAVDMDYIATLTGMSEDAIVNELKGQIFKNPQTGKYEEKAEYLSGNVRAKLLNAKAAAELDEAYRENVTALEEVQPIDLNPGQIWVKLGAPWVPESDIRDFIADLLDIGYSKRDLRVSYSAVSGSWVVDSSKLKNERSSMKATKVYGFAGSGNNAFDLIEKSLNYQAKTVSPSSLTGKDETVTDAHRKMAQEMTDAFQEKQRLIEEAFRKWIWQDTDRRERLTAKYNWEKNNTVDWEHDGSHLTFPGKSTNSFSFRRHQKDVIARIIRAGNTLVAHVVGAGKTGVMVGASMELKRLGLAKKNAIVVQKSTIRQITESYYELYPNAKVLAATDKDFSAANRKNFIARIATGDWDAVILSHEQFGMIEMSRKAQEEFIRSQIEELKEAKEIAAMEARAQGAKRTATTKDLEKAMQKLEEKLKKLLAKTKKDDVADFEQLGIDQIFVDEAQAYKNLYLYTSLGRVPGIGNSDTGRSSDMLLKTQFLSKLNGGQRGVVFLTGTPVSNSMTELFTMQRYLQPQLLKQMGLNSFDAWAKTFGEISSDVEYNLTGTGFRTKTRFRKFHNLPELIGMFRQVADIKMIEHLPEIQAVRPPHKTTSVAVEPSRQLKEYIDDLIKRAEALVKEKIDPREDNFLKVANDGRLAALDLRLVGMGYDDPHGKINVCVKNVYDTWKKTAKDKTTQAIFSDVGVPTEKKNKGKKKEALEKLNDGSDFLHNNDTDTDDSLDFLDDVNFDIYNDIKEKLIAKGVPENEIAFIHDAKNDNQRELMFEKVNSGEIRIVLGSTRKMGTGVNIQRLLGKVHHLDVPWLPASIEQRNGRAVRQGNLNASKEVEIIHYITQNSFDAYNWQLVENKATFIAQVLLGDKSIREMEDMGESASTASMMKAAASGNPLVGEKVKLDGEIKRLLSLQKHYESEKWTYQHQYEKTLPKKISELQAMVEKHEKTKASAPSLSGDDFKIKIGNKVFTDKKEANTAFTKEVTTRAKEYAKKNKLEKGSAETQAFNIGEIGNLELRLELDIRKSTVISEGQASTVYNYSAALFAVPKGGTKFEGFGYAIDEADYDSADYVTRLANALKRVDTAIKDSRAMLAQAEKDYKEAEKMVKEPWEHTEKLEKAQARSAELGRMLNEEAEKPEGEVTELPDEEEMRGPKFKLADDVAELAEALEDLNIIPAPEAMERDDMQAADIVAKLMGGAPVEPFKGAASPQGVAYGQKIFMNAKTKAPHMYVLKHEVVHELGITDPQALKELMALTKKYALDNKVIQRLVDAHYRVKGYDAEDVWEEFTADITSEVMEQPRFWKMVREKSPTLIKLIVDILDQIITKFSKAVAEEDSMLKYVKDMEAFKDEVAGVMARSLDRRPRNLLDLRQADAFAAKLKKGDNGKMETLYHGRRGEANFIEGRPAFFTSDKDGAEWYAEERGDFNAEPQVSEMNVSVNNPASYDDLMKAVTKTNATKQDIRDNSPYDGTNEVDYLYVPKVVKELERQGFDGFKGSDALMNQEIPITVAFSPKQIKPLKGESNLLAGIGTSKTEGNTGYHWGDLGKADYLQNMPGRGTGHFGTGTYFFGDKEAPGYSGYSREGRPLHEASFDGYRLYVPENTQQGRELHEFLKNINKWSFGTSRYRSSLKSLLDTAKTLFPEITGEIMARKIRELRKYAKESMDKDLRAYFDKSPRYDSPSTVFMKSLGYEGVDVRGLDGLDNSEFGSVIYDLKPGRNAKLKRSEGPKFTLPDEDVQARMEAARGITPESIKDKLMELKDDLNRKGHRVYEWLPNTGEFRPLKNALLNLRKQKGVAADRTQRYLMEVTKDLNEAEYEIFNYKVIFDDLAHDFEADMLLPFGLSAENFEENKAHIDAEAAKNPKVLEAIEKRKEAWEEVKGEYIKAQQAVGHRVEDKLKKEDYYRHQVLEYANAKSKQQAIKGTGKRLRTPTGRGFLKQREGSTFDINTDYLQAEFEVMAQMLLDAETAKVIKVVKDNHDIIKDLKREAIRLNDEAMMQEFERLLAIMQDTETTPEQLYRKTLNSKQGRAFADLYKLAAKGELPAGPNEKYQKLIDKMADAYWEAKKNKTDRAELPSEFKGQLFPYLNYLSGNEQTDSEQAKIVARSIFKGRAQKVKYIQKTLGNRYLTWEDLIPEGYVAWQPREGNLFYSAASIPEGLAEQLFFGIADEVGITKEMLSKEMVMGQKYPEIVIKEEVALTLEDLTKQAKQDGPVAKMYHTLYRSWKQFQLISPRRYFKYNIRNVTGDMDAVLAGNPKAMKKIPQAWEDLWQAFFAKDKVMSPELNEWFKRGGFETLMQCQEINDINRNRQFKNIMEGRLKQEFAQKNIAGKSWEIVKSGWNKYWDAARTTTDFREALLRYAVYLEYVEQMAGNKTGQPSNWGASNRDEVMSLKDMRDRAALLTNQLLGAYDEVSVMGTFLADNLLPFWRWNEVNFVRYSRLFKNAYQDGKLMAAMGGKLSGVAIRSPYIAWKFGKFAVKAALLTAMLTAWNLLFFDDEEKDLPEDVRGRLHIIFGRDKDGKVIYFSRLGALQDFLDWFGVDTPVQTTRDFLNGRKSLKEIATDIVASDANKIINAVTPFIKNTAEALVGVKLYPDAFKPTRIRDRWQYLADSFGLTNEYKALTGKPSRGYASSLPDLFVYRADPYETAYYGTLDEKYRFMEKIGKGSGTATISPKSEALYNVKAALRYGDKEAFQKYLLEYAARGGTVKGLNQSLNTMNPLYGLSDTEKQVFIQHLDREGKEDCLKAIEYYNKVITGQAGN